MAQLSPPPPFPGPTNAVGSLRAPGVAGHPAADLTRLASRLAGAADQQSALGSHIEGLPGPALIREIGERFGIEILLLTRALDQLTRADCPAVIVLKDGTSRLVLDVPPAGGLCLAGRDGMTDTVALAAMAPFATGAVFLGRRREAAPVAGGAVPVAATGSGSPPRITRNMGQGGASPSMAAEGHGRFGPVVGALLKACADQRQLVVSLAVASLLSGLIGLAVPVFTMVVFDRVIPHGAFDTLAALVIGILLLLAVDMALRHVRHVLGDAMSIRAIRDLGGRFFSRVVHAPLDTAPRNAGSLLQPYQEMRQSAQVAPVFVAGLLVDVPFFIVVVAFMASLGGWIAMVPVLGALALIALHALTHLSARMPASAEAQSIDRQNLMLVEATAAKETVHVTGSGPALLARWEKLTEQAALSGHTARGLSHLAAHGGALVAQLVTVATVCAGALAVSGGSMTVGALSACMMLSGRAIAPVAALLAQGFRLSQSARHSGALAQILSIPAERGTDHERPVGQAAGAYALENVSYRPSEDGRLALEGLSFRISPGERIAVIGKSGCGKSTLLRLLARLHAPTGGTIHLDGRHLAQIDPLTLRRDVALMSQEPVLMDGTLGAAMVAGLPPVDDSWFQKIADLTGVMEFASAQPAGFGLQVGVGGHCLSGGERQSVALARALMGRPRMLLLDEPTASMDTERETRVVQGLRHELTSGALVGCGMIVATHRLPILQLADRIIWLDRGRVLADGPREEIFQKLKVAA